MKPTPAMNTAAAVVAALEAGDYSLARVSVFGFGADMAAPGVERVLRRRFARALVNLIDLHEAAVALRAANAPTVAVDDDDAAAARGAHLIAAGVSAAVYGAAEAVNAALLSMNLGRLTPRVDDMNQINA